MSFHVLSREESAAGGWFEALLEHITSARTVATCSTADFIIPGIDPLNAHYPRYAAILAARGGPDAFFNERQQRMSRIWALLESPSLLPSLSQSQHVLLFDLESSHVPSSALCHHRKMQLPFAERLVHCSIASSKSNYRVGVDISFPGVIPESLGDESHTRVPTERRPVLMSFKGVCSHPVRKPLYALHNGDDIVMVDATQERQPAELRRMLGRQDYQYPDLSAASQFVVCPTGDDVYSFRFVEALSCGAIPVIFGDGWVLPFSELTDVDYDRFAVLMAEADAPSTAQRLRAISVAEKRALRAEGARVFEQYFATISAQLDAVVTILSARVRAAGQCSKAAWRIQTPNGGTEEGPQIEESAHHESGGGDLRTFSACSWPAVTRRRRTTGRAGCSTSFRVRVVRDAAPR